MMTRKRAFQEIPRSTEDLIPRIPEQDMAFYDFFEDDEETDKAEPKTVTFNLPDTNPDNHESNSE